jgi:peptide/nickel transport system substrate-binding protein
MIGCSLVLLAFCLGAFLISSAVTRIRATADPEPKHSIVYGLTLQPSGLDPHINASSELGIVLRSVYDTLVYRDPKTKDYVPGLALQTDVSLDGLIYTFKLRQDVRFHDDTPFNAQAVARTLDRITDPDTKSQKAIFLLGPYQGYKVVDQFTIQIILKTPYAALLDALSQPYLGIASPTALAASDSDRYQFHQVGSGPFKFVDYVPGDHVTIRRNPNYAWGPQFYTQPGADAVDEVIFRFYTDPPTRAPALEAGDVAVVGELSPTDARSFASNGDLRLVPQAVPGLPTQWLFNTARFPTDSLEVRQAILYATNRAEVVDSVFQEFSPVAYGPLNASTPYYDRGVQDFYKFNAGQAQKLLQTKGFQRDPADKLYKRAGAPLRLVMIVPRWGFHPEIAQKLQSLWRDAGIDSEIRVVPNLAGLLNEQKKGEYNLIAFNDSGVDASVLSRFYRSDATPNWTNFANPELDGWLTQAAQTLDPAQRADLYMRIQRRILEQALVLPIRDTVNLNGAKTRLNGLAYDAYGWYPLLNNLSVNSP